MAQPQSIGNRLLPPRFLVFLFVLAAGWACGIRWLGFERGVLLGFDLAAAVFLLGCVPLLKLDEKGLREAAAKNDANRLTLLAISATLSLVILAAITAQLTQRDHLEGIDKAIIAGTLVLVWVFGNAVYALHYAHLYYDRDDCGGDDRKGLDFPGDAPPDMTDFVYFAFTLGVAVQTSDVQITDRSLRRVVTLHCILGFFFNLGVLALSINVLGSS